MSFTIHGIGVSGGIAIGHAHLVSHTKLEVSHYDVPAAQLAEETGLPAPTVQKLVSRLTAAGLLRSVRGAGGGLKLARPAAAITLADIVEAVEGPITLTPCVDTGKHDCGMESACSVRPHWGVVNAAMRGALADVPLTRLAEIAA